MSQPFRFAFGDDEDIEEDHISDGNESLELANPSAGDLPPAGPAPCLHTLNDLLATLPSKLEYHNLTIPTPDHGNITLARRELFDIRAQLMAEDRTLDDASTTGLSTDDIKPNIYEGGFKTWECAVDLAKYLATQSEYLTRMLTCRCTVVELGAGTALPSQLIFNFLFQKGLVPEPPRTTMVLTDFNPSVLKLATIPNLLLNYQLAGAIGPEESGGDIECLDDLSPDFQAFLRKCNIEIRAISGSWGSDFATMALAESSETPNDVMILASETIYSPASTRTFTETLLDLLRRSEKAGGKAVALVAAKKVYFGVGGSVDDFLTVLRELRGEGKVVWATEGLGNGVGRCILEVRNRAEVDVMT
ncbi:hypothetical protein XANCAGTX0491_009805 [Xanthoria calcicola]